MLGFFALLEAALLELLSSEPTAGISFEDFATSATTEDENPDELSFSYGPLSSDLVERIGALQEDAQDDDGIDYDFSLALQDDVVDKVGQTFDDDATVDEIDYDFSFSLLEDAQNYAVLLEDAAEAEEFDYDFNAPLIEDSISADTQTILQSFEDIDTVDETDYDFNLAPQDLLVLDQVVAQALEDGTDDDADYDYSQVLAPLSANFVANVELQYQSFDDYADNENDDVYDYSFYLGTVGPNGAGRKVTGARTAFGAPCDTRNASPPHSTRASRQE